MAVWGVLFYYAIIDEVVDETDDTLENYAGILIEHALHDPSILETEGSFMTFYKFLPLFVFFGFFFLLFFFVFY